MSWTGIHKDDYGWVGKLTVQQDGTPLDISGYSTKQFVLLSPGGTDATVTAAFDTDGTDGVLAYTFQSSDIDEVGNWKVAARLSSGSAVLTSSYVVFNVDERIDG